MAFYTPTHCFYGSSNAYTKLSPLWTQRRNVWQSTNIYTICYLFLCWCNILTQLLTMWSNTSSVRSAYILLELFAKKKKIFTYNNFYMWATVSTVGCSSFHLTQFQAWIYLSISRLKWDVKVYGFLFSLPMHSCGWNICEAYVFFFRLYIGFHMVLWRTSFLYSKQQSN